MVYIHASFNPKEDTPFKLQTTENPSPLTKTKEDTHFLPNLHMERQLPESFFQGREDIYITCVLAFLKNKGIYRTYAKILTSSSGKFFAFRCFKKEFLDKYFSKDQCEFFLEMGVEDYFKNIDGQDSVTAKLNDKDCSIELYCTDFHINIVD